MIPFAKPLRAAAAVAPLLILNACGDDTKSELFDDINKSDPVIEKLEVSKLQASAGEVVMLSVDARDPRGLELSYEWQADAGIFLSGTDEAAVDWRAPGGGGEVLIGVRVRNSAGGNIVREVTIVVVSTDLPTVAFTQPRNEEAIPSLGSYEVTVIANHPNGIDRVEFLIGETLVHEDRSGPDFVFPWDVSEEAGAFEITARAWSPFLPDTPGIAAVKVFVESVVVP